MSSARSARSAGTRGTSPGRTWCSSGSRSPRPEAPPGRELQRPIGRRSAMMTSMRRPILLLALLSLGLSACGGLRDGDDLGPGGDPTDPPGIDHPTGPDQLVLRIDSGGGFVPPEFLLTDLPDLSLLGDGRLVVLGPQIEIYPGPALPNLQVRQLTRDGMQALLEAAREAGLFGPDAHYDNRCVADVPTTTFTLVAEGKTHMISAYALGVGDQEEDS